MNSSMGNQGGGGTPPSAEQSNFLAYGFGPDTFGHLKQSAHQVPPESWEDFGTGVRMARLKREGKTQFVLYEVIDGASLDAFQEHWHPGGEFYIVVEGVIYDENGEFGPGSVIWMPPGSKHTPRARGRTLIFVCWPLGVKLTKKV